MTPTASKPIASIKKFNGYYSRSGLTSFDDVPMDHLSGCYNCSFIGDFVGPRPGFSVLCTLTHNCSSFFVYSSAVKAATATSSTYPCIYMDNITGILYDGSNNTALIAFTGATGFVAIEAFGRVYFSPTVNGIAQASQLTYYWDGIYVHTLAAGTFSGPGAPAVAQVNSGIVSAGVHYVAVSYQYADGYLSPPSPIGPLEGYINSTGSNDIEVSSISIGGFGVVARVLLMTQANQKTLFFVPGGTINNNTTTTATINIADTALIASADYLNDILTQIPSCSSIRFYNGRMIFIGPSNVSSGIGAGIGPYNVLCSDVGIYDSVNIVTGIINIPRDGTSNPPNTGLVISNILYILKPFGTYSIQDNFNDPDTWNITIVDSALGGYDTSISIFSSGLSGQDVLDTSFVVSPRGLILFNGGYSDPPLSWKIESYWDYLNTTLQSMSPLGNPWSGVTIINDIVNKYLVIIIPGAKTLVMDYSSGLSYQSAKWTIWLWPSPFGSLSSGTVALDQNGNYLSIFCKGTSTTSDTHLYKLVPGQAFDITSSFPILQIVESPLFYAEEGAQTCFNGIRLRVSGSGNLNLFIQNEDVTTNTFVRSFNLTDYSAQDLYTGINFTNEKMMLALWGDPTTTGIFTLKRIDIFGNVRWRVRPSLTQAY
jgi:hypothetical protein